MGIWRSTSRARCALRTSRWINPPLARLTVAIGSPVEKWTASSFSSLSYGWPQRSTGKCTSVDPNRRRRYEAAIGTDAADIIPGILFVRRLAFPLVALQEPGHEELFRERRELDAAGLPVLHHRILIVEVDD